MRTDQIQFVYPYYLQGSKRLQGFRSGLFCNILPFFLACIFLNQNSTWQFQLTIFISLNYHCSFSSSSILRVFLLDFRNLRKQNSRVLDVRLWFEFASNCKDYSVFIVSLHRALFIFIFTTHACMYGYTYWYMYMCACIDVCINVFIW